MHLTGIELLEWIGLRRVAEGGVALHDSEYVHWGRKVPCYLPEVFGGLVEAELTDLLDVNRQGLRRMVVTPRGIDRYQGLSSKRGLPVDPEQRRRRHYTVAFAKVDLLTDLLVPGDVDLITPPRPKPSSPTERPA